ncbi:MAG: hypothetical protein KF745_06850 [Phycisphaeraceae bacterium]|nr:hypothetical protein [Phycisphaeraceae bacterium]
MAGRTGEISPGSSPSAQCVLLRQQEAPAPADLMQSLEKRRVEIALVGDAFEAMARVATIDHAATTAPAPSGGRFLIIVSPATVADAADLVVAAEKYAPAWECWMYDAAANPRLRRIVKADVEAWSTPGGASGQAGGAAPPGPMLRLASEEPAPPPAPSSRPGSLLSAEELEMLLSEAPPRPGAPSQRQPGNTGVARHGENGGGRP